LFESVVILGTLINGDLQQQPSKESTGFVFPPTTIAVKEKGSGKKS
jgi:hypothetical protein